MSPPGPPHRPLCPQGLLSFAEASNLPLTIHFDEPGRWELSPHPQPVPALSLAPSEPLCVPRPVIFALDDTVLEVHLVLATLSDLGSSSQSPSTNG